MLEAVRFVGIDGGVVSSVFETIKLTEEDVVVLPAASLATAVRMCEAFVAVVVFHEME